MIWRVFSNMNYVVTHQPFSKTIFCLETHKSQCYLMQYGPLWTRHPFLNGYEGLSTKDMTIKGEPKDKHLSKTWYNQIWKDQFLANRSNKQSFINMLSAYLVNNNWSCLWRCRPSRCAKGSGLSYYSAGWRGHRFATSYVSTKSHL